MFLIFCEKDNSHCKVNDFEVKFDEENIPAPGELVHFYWNTKEFQGKVIMYSEDENAIDAKLKDLTKINDKSRKNKSVSVVVTPKKLKSRKRRMTPEKKMFPMLLIKSAGNQVLKNSGDPDQTSQTYIEQSFNDQESTLKSSKTKKSTKSPTKQQLREELQKMQAQLDAAKGESRMKKESTSFARGKDGGKKRDSSPITESPVDSDKSIGDTDDDWVKSGSNEKKTPQASPSVHGQEVEDSLILTARKHHDVDTEFDKDYNDSECTKKLLINSEGNDENAATLDGADFYDEDVQLLGPKHNMKMIDIGKGIYCTEYRWNLAESSREGTIMIRHLMEGVFKHDKILNCTFTGQHPRNKPKSNEIYHPLHTKAASCIINLVLKRAQDNKWEKKTKHGFVSYTWEILQQAMSQRLGEIKRTYSENSKLQPKSNK